MFRKFFAVLLIGLLSVTSFVSGVSASNNSILNINTYQEYLKTNGYLEELEKFTQLSPEKQKIFIDTLNNPSILAEAIGQEYQNDFIVTSKKEKGNTFSFRSNNGTNYHYRIVDFTTSLFGIELVIVRSILNFESHGENVTKINYGTMSVHRNLAPGYAVSVGPTNAYITKNLGTFQWRNPDYRKDFAHLNGILHIQFGIQNIGGFTAFSRYPKIWIGADNVHLVDYDGQ